MAREREAGAGYERGQDVVDRGPGEPVVLKHTRPAHDQDAGRRDEFEHSLRILGAGLRVDRGEIQTMSDDPQPSGDPDVLASMLLDIGLMASAPADHLLRNGRAHARMIPPLLRRIQACGIAGKG